MDYREEHIRFVSGWSGTSLAELFLLLSLPHLATVLFIIIFPRVIRSVPALTSPLNRLLFEFCVLFLPIIACITCLSEWNHVVWSVMAVSMLTMTLISCRGQKSIVKPQSATTDSRPVFITCARGWLHLVTVLCILAVDFPVFPRRFAKAETYGCGLMDLAVGSFVISHGLTSCHTTRDRREHNSRPWYRRSVFSLAVLAALRLVLVKAVGYHEHVSEYGVHWNFFATLCVVLVLGALLTRVVGAGARASLTASVLLALLQQCLLTCVGLERWVLDANGADRSEMHVLDANREAVASLTGFLALYEFGVTLKRLLRPHVSEETAADDRTLYKAMYAALSSVLALLPVAAGYLTVSRRLANLAYLLTSAAFTVWLLAGFVCVQLWRRRPGDLVSHGQNDRWIPYILQLANKQGLLLFCTGNLLTGLINISMKTINCGDSWAMLIIVTYNLALLILLHARDSSTKLWQRKKRQ